MRTYGRVTDPVTKAQSWVKVETDANGFNDFVYVTTLIQCLKLNLNESPFYADRGIPAKQSVLQQIQPDYYAFRTQQQFAPYFANLMIAKQTAKNPTYRVNITLHSGVKINESVEIAK